MADPKVGFYGHVRQYHDLKDEIDRAIHDVLESGSYVLGPQLAEFERELARYINLQQAVGLNSGTDALATYALSPDGSVTLIDSAGNSQAATCWVAPARGFLFASNAGSGDVSRYSAGASGNLTLLGETATDAGTVDASASLGGHFLYVQTGGSGIVDEYRVGPAGSLSQIGSVTVAGAVGGEGIVAA